MNSETLRQLTVGRLESGRVLVDVADIRQLLSEREELIAALRYVANVAGNLRDDVLTERTGPNDAAHRGIMVVNARDVARSTLGKVTSETPKA